LKIISVTSEGHSWEGRAANLQWQPPDCCLETGLQEQMMIPMTTSGNCSIASYVLQDMIAPLPKQCVLS